MPRITFRNFSKQNIQLVIEPWAMAEPVSPGATALLEFRDPAVIEFCSNPKDALIWLLSDWVSIPCEGQQREFTGGGPDKLPLPGSERQPQCLYENYTDKDVALLVKPSADTFTVAPRGLTDQPWESMVWFGYDEPTDIEFAILENGQPRLTFNGNNVVANALHRRIVSRFPLKQPVS